ncbi:MAG TPA: hypothetical protein VNO26_12595 [Candidatus Limnocylindria bacterium]|nr:hypothetical protein [Candidatus Limnocylindria bacterium]
MAAVLLAASPAIAADGGDVGAGPRPLDAFVRLEKGMSEQQVLAAVGLPTAEGLYRPPLDRALSVIGLGTTYRTYFYRGMGRVLFRGGSKLLQNGTVAKVEVDTDEPGTPR